VQLLNDEAEAALAILELRAKGVAVPDSAWRRLFGSKGYALLKEREASMGRAFEDSSFRSFLMSDSLLARVNELRSAVTSWRMMNVAAPAQRALRYLPPGSSIRANLVPLIKPLSNSFVHFADSTPAMMLYVDPTQTRAQLENTLAHELHHIGYAGSCRATPRAELSEAVRTARLYAGAFGEGLAMLAAAGGPNVHPHQVSDSADRQCWDRGGARPRSAPIGHLRSGPHARDLQRRREKA
jgi:hypothetical protein